jgi:hypothetical protein
MTLRQTWQSCPRPAITSHSVASTGILHNEQMTMAVHSLEADRELSTPFAIRNSCSFSLAMISEHRSTHSSQM